MERTNKPWGHYEDYVRQNNIVFKRLVIYPGQKISYQVHEKRTEIWYIESGSGLFKFSLANQESALESYSVNPVRPGESVTVMSGMAHQLINNGTEDLVLWEFQFGQETSEGDIIRLEDPYGR